MEIHVSREYQEVIVPRGDRSYLFARCPDCSEMCYIIDADAKLVSGPEGETDPERVVEPYDPMEIPEEELVPLLSLVAEYERSLEKDNEATARFEARISELSGQIFEPYLREVQ